MGKFRITTTERKYHPNDRATACAIPDPSRSLGCVVGDPSRSLGCAEDTPGYGANAKGISPLTDAEAQE